MTSRTNTGARRFAWTSSSAISCNCCATEARCRTRSSWCCPITARRSVSPRARRTRATLLGTFLTLRASYGHGTNVFAEGQYRVLLAMQSLGSNGLTHSAGLELAVPASLEDIAPTIADALRLEPKQPFDGISWLGELNGAPNSDNERAHTLPGNRVRTPRPRIGPRRVAQHAAPGRTLLSRRCEDRPGADSRRTPAGDHAESSVRCRLAKAHFSRPCLRTTNGKQHVVYLERPAAEPVWLTTAPTAAGDTGYELWNALQARFELVRERPIAPP